ncbi:MAG: Cys-tRNA(Pro) deacylase [Oscillospiraceae bacterium]|jgi:Cys-tRNA(Pro)/Cys-tRNA(Cys) deacylase
MKGSSEKTNVMRILDREKVPYTAHFYDSHEALSGTEVADVLGEPVEKVFKTLVCVGKSGNHYVFMIPAAEELDLKKAAAAVGEKSMEMLKMKELFPLTGYVHGGCSPIGMKKQFRTTVHESARNLDTILFSAGKIGAQVETTPAGMEKAVRVQYADIIK